MMLNIGCGNDYREEFINIDVRPEVSPDVVCDATRLPFEDNTFETAIAKDVLEHFPNPVEVLREWNRVITHDGALVVQVPDWNVLGDKDYWWNKDLEQVEKHVYGGHKNPFDQHHTLWTRRIGQKRLRKAGFDGSYVVELRTPPLHWHLCIVGFNSKEYREATLGPSLL